MVEKETSTGSRQNDPAQAWPSSRTGRGRRREQPDIQIFTVAQAAMWRMTPHDPGPARSTPSKPENHHRAPPQGPEASVETRWCPSHCGIEKADDCAKQAAEEPDSYDVEWLRYKDRYGSMRAPSSVRSRNRTPAGGLERNSPGPRTTSTGQARKQKKTGPDNGSNPEEARLEVLSAEEWCCHRRIRLYIAR